MKTLYAIILCICLAPAALAAGYSFGDCPTGYSCEERPAGAAFPPDAVTGHTVFAKWVIERQEQATLGLPTDFAAVAGFFALNIVDLEGVQRECVTWFDGGNVDQRGNGAFGRRGPFPSDEDQAPPADVAEQDHTFDRDAKSCRPRIEGTVQTHHAAFAVAVEKGDCAPHLGRDIRFRGHLDFVDPNGIYHEVQEYDYVCGHTGGLPRHDLDGAEGVSEALHGAPNTWLADAAKDLFPSTWTDARNDGGCKVHGTPADNADPVNGTKGHFDLGHKCNGSVQDLFTERLWITPMHEVMWDATIQAQYNFALQVDTCSGVNIYERSGKSANATDYPPDGDRAPFEEVPGGGEAYDQGVDALDPMSTMLPLIARCTDGSSWSFDDTPRGRTVHDAPPPDEEEVMRGNSYDHDASSTTFGKHRQNCRMAEMRWPENDHRPVAGDTECYPEDHKTAQVDLYVYDRDPTRGLFAANSHGLTGTNAYVGGTATDADGRQR